MNVTDKEIKRCQPCRKGSLQKDNLEGEEYAGVCDSLKITENNITNASMSKEKLLEKILDRKNLNEAFKRVKSNKGSHGKSLFGTDDVVGKSLDIGPQTSTRRVKIINLTL